MGTVVWISQACVGVSERACLCARVCVHGIVACACLCVPVCTRSLNLACMAA